MKYLLLIGVVLVLYAGHAQSDSFPDRRKWLVGGATTVLTAGSLSVLASVWYADYPKSSFHSFDDSREWLQMDKLGHAYTANVLSQAQYQAWKWAGASENSAIWRAGAVSWGYLLGVEILDGFNQEWGFSFSDLAANTAGTGMFMLQQAKWGEQRVQLKFGYRASSFAALRPQTLGSKWSERLLKDYNAQSYWIAAAPTRFMQTDKLRWLQLAIGYSAHEKLFGNEDHVFWNDQYYTAKREWAIGLDVDWSQIPIRKPWLRKSIAVLNAVKIPLPSIFWRNGVCYLGVL